MRDFVILSDLCCDLDAEKRAQFNVDYFKMYIEGGESTMLCSLEWDTISAKGYYDNMRAGVRYRSTQITMEMFEEAFERHLSQGRDVLYISLSSALSGSYNASLLVSKEILLKYPEGKIMCCDSRRASLGQGYLVMGASKQRAAGKSVEETADWVNKNRNRVHQCGTVEDLVYLKRSGRISGAAAVMGSLVKLKPIIISNTKGENVSADKALGSRKAFIKMVEYVKNNVIGADEQTLLITHSDCLDKAHLLRDQILAEVKFKDCYINYINPGMGSSVGPGTVAVYFFGKEVTV